MQRQTNQMPAWLISSNVLGSLQQSSPKRAEISANSSGFCAVSGHLGGSPSQIGRWPGQVREIHLWSASGQQNVTQPLAGPPDRVTLGHGLIVPRPREITLAS